MHYSNLRYRDISGSSANVSELRASTYYLALSLFIQYISGPFLDIPLGPHLCGQYTPWEPIVPLLVHSEIYTYVPCIMTGMWMLYLTFFHYNYMCPDGEKPLNVCLVGIYQTYCQYTLVPGVHCQLVTLDFSPTWPMHWRTFRNPMVCSDSHVPLLGQSAASSWQFSDHDRPLLPLCLGSITTLCARTRAITLGLYSRWRSPAAKPAIGLYPTNHAMLKMTAYALFGLWASLWVEVSRPARSRTTRYAYGDRWAVYGTLCQQPVYNVFNAGDIMQIYLRIFVPHHVNGFWSNCGLDPIVCMRQPVVVDSPLSLYLYAHRDLCSVIYIESRGYSILITVFTDIMCAVRNFVTHGQKVYMFDTSWFRIICYLVPGTLLFYEWYVDHSSVYCHPDAMASSRSYHITQGQCPLQYVYLLGIILGASGDLYHWGFCKVMSNYWLYDVDLQVKRYGQVHLE